MSNEIIKPTIGQMMVPNSYAGIDTLAEKFADVMHMEDVQNIVSAFNEQDELLKRAEEYGEMRARYAALEAVTYCKLAEKGWSSTLGAVNMIRRRASEWLAKQEPRTYHQVIDGVLSGKYSDLVDAFKCISGARAKSSAYKFAIGYKHDCIDEFKRTGRTSISKYNPIDDDPTGEEFDDIDEVDSFKTDCNPVKGNAGNNIQNILDEIAEMARDSTRIALRRAGAVGVGDGKYIDPALYPNEIVKAVGIRKANVAACVKSLMLLCKDAGIDFEPELKEALSMVNWTSEQIMEMVA